MNLIYIIIKVKQKNLQINFDANQYLINFCHTGANLKNIFGE